MANYEPKTRANDASVEAFIGSVEDATRRQDALQVLEMYERVTGEKAKMWGPAIVGFGSQMLKYPNGREIEWPKAAFSPRKANTTLYVVCASPNQPELLARLGKHTTGKGCLYIKRLSDVSMKVLEEIIADAYRYKPKK